MFSLSELWSVGERPGRYKLLQPWWEVFMDYLVLLMLMVSVLASTLLLSRDGVVCVPVHSHSSKNSTSLSATPLGPDQYLYISQVCYQEALPWFSRFLPYITLLQSLLLVAGGCFWFHFPLTSARIEHFLAILAKCCESPWTSRALSRAARQDGMRGRRPEEEPPATAALARRPSLDSGTDSSLLVRTGSASTGTQPSPYDASLRLPGGPLWPFGHLHTVLDLPQVC
uniref:LRRC8 pannexin-like TM region domain-containing protein n=1 Tax=Electrophorus electricus TaxID=8005 RepID=A0AAY5EDP2_ELEEL